MKICDYVKFIARQRASEPIRRYARLCAMLRAGECVEEAELEAVNWQIIALTGRRHG
jgi:hypothetical protein